MKRSIAILYRCSDGQTFDTEDEARRHQDWLNRVDDVQNWLDQFDVEDQAKMILHYWQVLKDLVEGHSL